MITSRWNIESTALSPLDQRLYSSRLIGQDSELVVAGGGNTSVKDSAISLMGRSEAVLRVKASGAELASVTAGHFAGLWLKPLQETCSLEALGDNELARFLRSQKINPDDPDPSVETLLHAYLPHRFVDHTHAKAILALTCQSQPEDLLKKIYGNQVAIVPYVMPGFRLAKLVFELFQQNASIEGLVLIRHGLVTFGDTARESYERTIKLARLAEEFIENHKPDWTVPASQTMAGPAWMQNIRAQFLKRGLNCVLACSKSPAALSLANHPRLPYLASQGPVSPDYVARIRSFPLALSREETDLNSTALSAAFDRYQEAYEAYFARQLTRKNERPNLSDTLPRVVIVPGIGIVAAGRSRREAETNLDIMEHSVPVLLTAEALGGFQGLTESERFEVEYWEPQQKKLSSAAKRLPLSGKIAVVTGGASGIGLAITKEYLVQGASVFVLDVNASKFDRLETELRSYSDGAGSRGFLLTADVTSRNEVETAFSKIVETVGGVDIIVVNAGIFSQSQPLEEVSLDSWERSLDVNLSGAFHTVAVGLRYLKEQGSGGDIVVIASKNVPAPGRDAAAYSVSKAGQTQLARVCALEAGSYGIRVNMLHPHLIFDTDIWSDDVLEKRAKAYGMTKEQYKTNNLLRTALDSSDVAKAAFALVGGFFSKTTGAQIPIDGGSDRTL